MSVYNDDLIEPHKPHLELELDEAVDINENKFLNSNGSRAQAVFNTAVSKGFVKYFDQLIILYLIIRTSLGMLILAKHEEKTIWSSLLGSSFGLLIQGPRLKKDKIKF